MDVLSAVLRDLWLFVFKYRFGTKVDGPEVSSRVLTKSIVSDTDGEGETVAAFTTQVSVAAREYTASTTEPSDTSSVSDGPFDRAYVCVKTAQVYALPTKTFDGVIMTLEYAQVVGVLNKQGSWVHVSFGEVRGWISRDDLSDSLAALQPQWQVNELYAPDHPGTKALRLCIEDEFNAKAIFVPLQDVEYVSYQLRRKNRFIDWPKERPRIAGTWQRLLRGVRGVHIGITPKTESVMEYIYEDNTGHVAFVESVFPDGSIAISEVGYPTEGVYTTRTLSRDECKELRPVFIEVA